MMTYHDATCEGVVISIKNHTIYRCTHDEDGLFFHCVANRKVR